MSVTSTRSADHPIDPQFLHRWSPRAFTGEPIEESTLLTFLEAARWAPSAFNLQPWRFLYARRNTPQWDRFLPLLNDYNRSWAVTASALVIVLAKTTYLPKGATEEVPSTTYSYDAGAAWGFLALQASLSGWAAHGIAGIERDKIRAELGVPDGYAIEAGIVIGKVGDKNVLPESLRAREVASPRNTVQDIAAEGDFSF
jgi:nitroreductase